MREMSAYRGGFREALLALLVLSLTFLNFGHQSLVIASGGRIVITAWSICGDHDPTPPGDHFACHGCRQDVPTLPPPPVAVQPVAFCTDPVVYATTAEVNAVPDTRLAPSQRGPPESV